MRSNLLCLSLAVESRCLGYFRQKLDQMLQNAYQHKTAVEHEVNEREVQRDGLLNQLEKHVHAYTNHARKLKLIPLGSKHSMGVDFSIGIDRNAQHVNGLCSVDHKVSQCREE